MKYKLHPLFILYLIFLLIMGQFEGVLIYILVVSLHEFAHSYTARKLGYKLDKLLLMPYGVCLNYKTNNFLPKDEILIAISGPLINILLSIVTIALWWIFPVSQIYTKQFCYANMVMFVFNLLPCYPLDGGRVLAGIITKKYDRKLAIKVTVTFNLLICLVFILTFISGLFFGVINTNILIMCVFLFLGILEPQKSTSYGYLSLYSDRKNVYKKGNQIKFTLVFGDEPIYKIMAKMSKFKFNVFYVLLEDKKMKIISEITLNNFALKYGPTTKVGEIFK